MRLQPLRAAKTFHPDLFPNINLISEVKNFYTQFNAILNPASPS